MIQIYADLVELGLRSLEENDKGVIQVPVFLKEKVVNELERRKELTKTI